MWPTEQTLILLVIGLLPIIYAGTLAMRYGVNEISSLRFIGILLFWMGYHFSPWQSYLSGEAWDRFLLVPHEIDNALLFTTMAMFAFLVGYSMVFRKKFSSIRKKTPASFMLPRIKPSWVMALSLVVLAITITTAGGIAELWDSEFARGHSQFEKRDFVGSIFQAMNVMRLPLQLSLALMASLLLLRPGATPQLILLGVFALLIASLGSIAFFSRAAGFPFFLLAFFALRFRVRRSLVVAFGSTVIALYLGAVGYAERGNYHPGIGNFIQAMWEPGDQGFKGHGSNSDVILVNNSLDASAPFTRKAEARSTEQPDLIEMGAKFIWNLNPFPSEFFPLFQLGTGLAEVMGTVGSTGITTPSFAEVYYVFGMMGFLLVAALGASFGWFERLALIKPGVPSSIAIALSFVAIGIGLHSSMRASTRPIIYALFIILIFDYFIKKRKNPGASKRRPSVSA